MFCSITFFLKLPPKSSTIFKISQNIYLFIFSLKNMWPLIWYILIIIIYNDVDSNTFIKNPTYVIIKSNKNAPNLKNGIG